MQHIRVKLTSATFQGKANKCNARHYVCSGLVSALEKGKQPERALEICKQMQHCRIVAEEDAEEKEAGQH